MPTTLAKFVSTLSLFVSHTRGKKGDVSASEECVYKVTLDQEKTIGQTL